MKVGCLNASLVPDGGVTGLDTTRALHFVARTYVGPRELRPDQRAFLARWADFSDRHGASFAPDGWMAMHTGCFAREILDAQASGLHSWAGEAALEAAYAELAAMFRDPDVLRAMGATGPAAAEPIPYWRASITSMERLKAMTPQQRLLASHGIAPATPAPVPLPGPWNSPA